MMKEGFKSSSPGGKDDKTALQKMKTGFGRRKQEIMTKMGKAEGTVDTDFNETRQKISDQERKLRKLHGDMLNYIRTLKALSAAELALVQDINDCYDESTPMREVATQYMNSVRSMGALRAKMEEQLNSKVVNFIDGYLNAHLPVLERRTIEREKRRIDRDRYERELKVLTEKSNSDRIPRVEKKLNIARDGYTALNNEMKNDMKHMLSNNNGITDTFMALLESLQMSFYSTVPEMLRPINENLSQIDASKLSYVPFLFTPDERSAATNYVKPSVIVAKEKDKNVPKIQFYEDKEDSGGVSDDDMTSIIIPYPPSPSTPKAIPTTPVSIPIPTAAAHQPTAVDLDAPFVEPTVTSSSESTTSAPESVPVPAPIQRTPSSPALKPFKAKAAYSFQPVEDNELGFEEDDVLTVLKKKGDWWVAELNGKQGLVPSNYLEALPDE